METREGQDVEVRRGPDIVVTTTAADPAPDGPPPAPPRRRLLVALVAVLTLAALVSVALVLVLGGEDEPVETAAPAAGPASPAELGMTVELPETVVAGQTAEIVVRWTDGARCMGR